MIQIGIIYGYIFMMYHFQNQQIIYNGGTYGQYNQEKITRDLPNQHSQNTDYKLATQQNTVVDANGSCTGASSPPQNFVEVRSKPKQDKRQSSRNLLDTSTFSVEERLIAAVWVHERKRTKTSISQIKNNFLARFGREPPAKNTLLVWERKLFASGSVHDAPRTGRPINRRNKVNEVAASLSSTPSLSMRARAATLHMPVTTLRTILYKDLQHMHLKNKDIVVSKGKQPVKAKKNIKKLQASVQYENVPFTQPLPSGTYSLVTYANHTYT